MDYVCHNRKITRPQVCSGTLHTQRLARRRGGDRWPSSASNEPPPPGTRHPAQSSNNKCVCVIRVTGLRASVKPASTDPRDAMLVCIIQYIEPFSARRVQLHIILLPALSGDKVSHSHFYCGPARTADVVLPARRIPRSACGGGGAGEDTM